MSLSLPADAEDGTRLRGISIYLTTMLCFASLDACAKYAGRYVPAMEVAWARFAVNVVLALIVLRPWRNLALYRTGRPLMQLVRALFLVAATVLNFLALRTLQLDQTVSIAFASPFIIAALAGPILGEWAGVRRWAAILVGFCGVLVVTLPGLGSWQAAILFSIGQTFAYSFYILSTRLLASTESSVSLVFFSAAVPAVLLAPAALPLFVLPPTPLVAFCLLMTGVFGLVGHWCVVMAHKLAPAPVLAPFVYTQIIWMILLGYLAFGDVPAPRTLVGTAIIVASGLYLIARERFRAPQLLPRPPDDV